MPKQPSKQTPWGQVNALEKAMASRKHPVMILGDFNATPSSETMKIMAQSWSILPKKGFALTCPADKPKIEIDYMVTRGFSLESSVSHVGDESVASDHRPLFGTVVW